LHVLEWYYTYELDLWINSYGTPKFQIVSIRGKIHPLFLSELSLRIKIFFHYIILDFCLCLGILSFSRHPLNLCCQVRRLGGGVYVVHASWSMEDHGSVRRVSLGGSCLSGHWWCLLTPRLGPRVVMTFVWLWGDSSFSS
jgi:hypothetical protein